ncbi:DUF368 domain-containing protein [Candidatus Mcinerneyibacteriota bacterium]|nr:DUF368 domain-containing protein [Candidatus Mcinerneyibacteriota bacterium]
MTTRNTPFTLIIKGFLMGIADIIPGISGGTIALLAGIYTPFIEGLSALTSLFTDRKAFQPHRDFLLLLGAGILTALVTGIKVMSLLLSRFPAETYAFFIGLILFSLHQPLKEAFPIKGKRLAALTVGAIAAFLVSGLPVREAGLPGAAAFFPAGIFAVSAMMLPGISGSFILLITGFYEPVISYGNSFIDYIFSLFSVPLPFPAEAFLALLCLFAGIGLGLMTVSKGIKALLSKYHGITLAFLSGFIAGALRKPASLVLSHAELRMSGLFTALIFLLLGGMTAALLLALEKRRRQGNSRP